MPNQFLRHPHPTHTVNYRAEALELAKSKPELCQLLLELKASGAFTWREIVRKLRDRLTD